MEGMMADNTENMEPSGDALDRLVDQHPAAREWTDETWCPKCGGGGEVSGWTVEFEGTKVHCDDGEQLNRVICSLIDGTTGGQPNSIHGL